MECFEEFFDAFTDFFKEIEEAYLIYLEKRKSRKRPIFSKAKSGSMTSAHTNNTESGTIAERKEEMNATTELKPCPKCGEIPTVAYACGEYFILPISKPVGACVCSSFTEMHASEEQEIEGWNRRIENNG